MDVTIKLKKSQSFPTATQPDGIDDWGPGDWGPYSSKLVDDAIAAGVHEAGLVYVGAGIANSIMNHGLPEGMTIWSPGDPPTASNLTSYGNPVVTMAVTYYEPSLGDFDIVVG